ncbi:MAG: AAA family ATPase, partial [Clostridia bacterium]
MGGVLFIDEAYSLARGGEKDFGKEAIDCLTKAMEDQKTEFICILAGYTDEMDDFLQINPGLPSRFPIQIHFQDYNVEELIRIAELITSEKEYALSDSARDKLRTHLIRVKNDPFLFNFSNARYVRNVLEQSIRTHAVRMVKVSEPTIEQLMTLKTEDLKFVQTTY